MVGRWFVCFSLGSMFESNPYCQELRRWKCHLTVVFAYGITGRSLELGKVTKEELLWFDFDGFIRRERPEESHIHRQAPYLSLTIRYQHHLRSQVARRLTPTPWPCTSEPRAKRTSFHYSPLNPQINTPAAFLQPSSLPLHTIYFLHPQFPKQTSIWRSNPGVGCDPEIQ